MKTVISVMSFCAWCLFGASKYIKILDARPEWLMNLNVQGKMAHAA